MKTTLPIVLGIVSILSQPLSAKSRRDHAPVDPSPAQNKVQIALLLDTSNSMDGLIDQAKTQLWKVINTFIDARRDGARPSSRSLFMNTATTASQSKTTTSASSSR